MDETTKYYKTGGEFWRFPDSGHPEVKVAARQRWVEGHVKTLDEFLTSYRDAEETTRQEAERTLPDLTEQRIGLW